MTRSSGPGPAPRRARGRRTDERGFVLVWFALMLALLIGITGFAVDFAHWYFTQSKEQKAADSASLAGAIFLPENVGNLGFQTAKAVAAANGFTDGVNGVTVTVAFGARPSQLKVTITRPVDNLFASILGFKSEIVSKTSVAEYVKPVAMGSPSNQFGNDPESISSWPPPVGSQTYPNFWGNVASVASVKINGDAYQGGDCNGAPDNCTSPPSDTSCGYADRNSDYDCKGYFYSVHFNQTATVDLQAFDPGMVDVGDTCGPNDDGSNLQGAAGLTAAQVKGWPGGAIPPATRYKWVTDVNSAFDSGFRFCTGDQPFALPGNLPTTRYTLYGPAAVPGDPSTASPTACTWTFPGVSGNGVSGGLATLLQSNTKVAVSPTPQLLGAYFRQWFTLCGGLKGTAGQDYFIQVRGLSGAGHNRFALRASGGGGGAVNVYGNAKMGIYANVGSGALTEFYLARILPSAAGHTLVLNLFDIGDSGNGAVGTLTIKPPADSNVGGSFNGCTYTQPPGNSTGPPWGGTTSAPGCAIGNVTQSKYNGQWIQVKVPIPSTYTCLFNNPDGTPNPNGCWVKIDYLFNKGILDTTSWAAFVEGDPVHIIL